MMITPVQSDKFGLKQKLNFCWYEHIQAQGSKTIFPMKNFSLKRTKNLKCSYSFLKKTEKSCLNNPQLFNAKLKFSKENLHFLKKKDQKKGCLVNTKKYNPLK